ncbi:hypothetical protein NKF06_19025 [Haloferax sp. AB510]|uniref:hypothetical protein n=1 Tax=Haloferax sp. AB510 TaxID=2934172 RepID=UPI00209C6460|nr:hypothetical protein [Haloferax sp. AB510]MCO8268614.1 hypothetical protein [Haloferax sp. AB510]
MQEDSQGGHTQRRSNEQGDCHGCPRWQRRIRRAVYEDERNDWCRECRERFDRPKDAVDEMLSAVKHAGFSTPKQSPRVAEGVRDEKNPERHEREQGRSPQPPDSSRCGKPRLREQDERNHAYGEKHDGEDDLNGENPREWGETCQGGHGWSKATGPIRRVLETTE